MHVAHFNNPKELVDFVNGTPAKGAIRLVAKVDLDDGDYVEVPESVLARVRFWFDVTGTFTPGGGYNATNVRVNLATDTTDLQVAARLRTAVNAATLAVTAAAGTDNVVALSNDADGPAGNVPIVKSSSALNLTVSGMAGGAGPVTQANIHDVISDKSRWTLVHF